MCHSFKGIAHGTKEGLMEIVAESKKKYLDLTADEKQTFVEKLQAHQDSKLKGRCMNVKSRAQDVRHTLHHVAVEVRCDVVLGYM